VLGLDLFDSEKEWDEVLGLDLFDSEKEQIAGGCKCSYEPTSAVNLRNFLAS
jgi:hypothetical protein